MTNKNMRPSVLWYYDTDDRLKFISFTALMEENHQSQATVSKYPVQKGFEISNHLIRHNKTINVRAYIPETLIGGIDATGANVGFQLGGLGNRFLGTNTANIGAILGGVAIDPTGVVTNYLEGAVSAVAPVVTGIVNPIEATTNKSDGWLGTDIGTDVGTEADKYLTQTSRRVQAFNQLQQIQDEGYLCELSTVLKEYKNLVLTNISIPTNEGTMTCMYVDLVFEEVIIVDSLGNEVTSLVGGSPTQSERENAIARAKGLYESGAVGRLKDFEDITFDTIAEPTLGELYA